MDGVAVGNSAISWRGVRKGSLRIWKSNLEVIWFLRSTSGSRPWGAEVSIRQVGISKFLLAKTSRSYSDCLRCNKFWCQKAGCFYATSPRILLNIKIFIGTLNFILWPRPSSKCEYYKIDDKSGLIPHFLLNKKKLSWILFQELLSSSK